MLSLRIVVYGKVQGVFFRKYTQQIAKSLSLEGFVRNNRNGSVYIEVTGEEDPVNKLMEWCKKGPAASKVEKIETEEITPSSYKGFEIRHTV
ncbi:MAG: acylphosphatase [Bacteroidota bacterium]